MISKQKKLKRADIGLIPEDWEEKSVGDFVDIKHGYGFKGEFFTENPNENIVLTPGNFYIGGGFKSDKFKFTTETPLKEYVLNDGDIIVTMTDLSKEGDTLGYSAKVPASDCHKYLHNQRIGLLCLKTNAILPDFLYWVLRTKSYNQFVVGSATGSTVKHTSPDRIKQFTFGVPSLKEQTFIANLLSSLDSKIQLNHQMNCSLEAVGAALFRRWFVDFEFPNQEGKPYRSTGGKMQYNKDLGKDVPAEWEVTTLEKVAEFTRGFSYSGAEKSSTNGDLVFMTLNSIYEGGGFKREFSYLTSDRLKERHLVREGDIIIANTEQTKSGTLLGFPALVEFPNDYPKQVGCFSHHITKVTPYQEEMKYYLYHYLRYNQLNAIKYHTGSVIWGLDVAGFIKNEKIIIPDKKVLNLFSKLLDTIFQKILLNNKQSTNLVTLRDSLLPKLMSGKIRVPINKENVEMAVT